MKLKKLLPKDMDCTNDTYEPINYGSNLDGKAVKIGDENTTILTLITYGQMYR